MKIVDRYIIRHFLPVFGLCLFAGAGLYFVIDFFEKIDNLLEKNVSSPEIISYFLFKIPAIISQSIPLASLLGSLIALGILKRNRELIALEAAGIHSRSYVKPVLICAGILAFCQFLIDEGFARSMIHRAQQIWYQRVEDRKESLTMSHENIWFHGSEVIYQIRFYNKADLSLERVSLFFLDDSFRLTERLDAKRLVWRENGWSAYEGLVLRFEESAIKQEWFEEKPLQLAENPQDFERLETIPEELGWMDLYSYSRRIQQEGYNARPYQVELNLRLALAFSTFVLALLGATTVLIMEPHGGIAKSAAIALGITSVYFAFLQVGSALAVNGILPVIPGVWAGNFMFSAASFYLWIARMW